MFQDSTSRLRLAIETAGLMLSETDMARGVVRFAPSFAAWLGCPTEIPVADAWGMVHPDDRSRVEGEVASALAARRDVASEHRLVLPGETVRWVSVQGTSVPTAGAEPPTIYQWVTRDITDRKQVELALRESEARFRAMTEQVEVGIGMVAPDGRIVYVNDRYCEIAGRKRASLLGLTVRDITHPDDWHGNEPLQQRLMTDGTPFTFEKRLVRPDGTLRWARVTSSARRAPDGRVLGGLAVTIDLTDRRLAEEALRASEERFRFLADSMPQLVWIARDDGEVTYYNSRAALYDGIQAAKDDTFAWRPLLHPDDVTATVACWSSAVAGSYPYECEHRVRMADGSYRWHLSRASRVVSGHEAQWFGTATDIHDLKEAQDALRLSEERLRLAADAARFGAYDLDPQRQQVVWSSTLRELMGVPYDEPLSGDTSVGLVHPDDRDQFLRTMSASLAPEGGGVHDFEFRVIRRDGQVRWMHDTGRTRFEEHDGVRRATRVVGIVQDVTEQAQLDLSLRESEERFRIMADECPVIIWVTNADGALQFVNRTYCQYFGVSAPHVGGADSRPTIHPDDHAYLQTFRDAVATRTPFAAEARVRRFDSQWRWITSYGTPRYSAAREFLGFVGTSQDVTAQKRARAVEEEAAREKDQFIAVLAHELRNPLAPIRTSVALLRARSPHDPFLAKCRDVIDR